MKLRDFKSAHRLAQTTIAFLIVDIGCYVAEIIYTIIFVAYFPDLGEAEELTGPEALMSLFALGLMVVNIVAHIATIIFFLMWLHRVYKNLTALNVQGLQASPGWAVGYWFIPIANLFKPLQIVNEVYHSSNSENLNKGYSFSDNSTIMLTGFWWACWLVSGFARRIAGSIERAAKDVTNVSILFDMISVGVGVIASILLIFIIQEIDEQQSQAENLASMSEPPPPPTFDGQN